MRDEDIHIGDTLRIRSYEDMKSEFGADADGWIFGDNNTWFAAGMRKLCGKIFTVLDILYDEDGYEYRSMEGVEGYNDDDRWSICAWMLEPYEDDVEWEIADDNEIALLFS